MPSISSKLSPIFRLSPVHRSRI